MGKMMDYYKDQMKALKNNTSKIEIHNVDNGARLDITTPDNQLGLFIATGLAIVSQSDQPEVEETDPNIAKMYLQAEQIHKLIGFLEQLKRTGQDDENGFAEPLINALFEIL